MSSSAPASSLPVARAATALCGTWCMFQVLPWSPRLLSPGILLVLMLVVLVLVVRRSDRTMSPRPLVVTMGAAAAVGVVVLEATWSWTTGSPVASVVVTTLLLCGAAAAVLARSNGAGIGLLTVLAVYVGATLVDLPGPGGTVDVQLFLEGAIDALLSGSSPYAITIPDVYPPEDSARFYGPGVVVDGRVTYGYPYLPVPLLLDLPAHLAGDARWMHTLALVVTALVVWAMATDVVGRLCALLLVLNPISGLLLYYYWVEPLMGCLLAIAVWCLLRGMPGVGVTLGLLLASKQYAISYLPTLWTVTRASSLRVVAVAVTVAGLLVVGFAVLDLDAFVRSAVRFMFVQPYREDGMSLAPGLIELVGPLPGWLLAASPLFGILASALLAWRAAPGPTAVALGVGLGLLCTVLLSKMAFMNYYSFIGTALLVATATWPSDDPVVTPVREAESADAKAMR